MRANITDIDQRLSLDTGRITSFLVLQLPSGRTVRTTIDETSLALVVEESQDPRHVAQTLPTNIPLDREGQFTEVNPLARQTVVPPPDEEVYPHHVASGVVEWERLPDTQLPPLMKQIMRDSKLSPTITIEELDKLKVAMASELSQRPIVGQVNFNGGNQRPVTSVGRRTVPMDIAGNPIPPGGVTDPDPGEAPDDEDGVAQV